MRYLLLILGSILLLNSCSSLRGSIYQEEPVGIGPGYPYLKKSPCACLQIKPKEGLPDWFKNKDDIMYWLKA